MKFIGITGGVGTGKSEVLSIISRQSGCRVLLADEVAHLLMEPGTSCYQKIKEVYPDPILYNSDGTINRKEFASFLFASEENREGINRIVHPAVKEYVLAEVEKERSAGKLRYFFFEAALLIEEHYDAIMDELWYIYTDEETRIKRLMDSRGYSREKCVAIIRNQCSEETFRKVCNRVITNNTTVEALEAEIIKQING